MGSRAGLARVLLALLPTLLLGAYGTALGVEGAKVLHASITPGPTASPVTVEAKVSAPTATVAVDTEPVAKEVAAPRSAPDRARVIAPGTVFARVAGIALVHPARRVERVGFHQASDVESLNMTPAGSATRGLRLPSRFRPTSRHTAADIVVDPRGAVHSPVTGVVTRAGHYSLYCKTPDNFIVISPVGRPDLEVKVLHVSGRRVRAGDSVVAGETVLGTRPTKLPFGSQVDAYTAAPAWPHVHLEVTKLKVPNTKLVLGPNKLAFDNCG